MIVIWCQIEMLYRILGLRNHQCSTYCRFWCLPLFHSHKLLWLFSFCVLLNSKSLLNASVSLQTSFTDIVLFITRTTQSQLSASPQAGSKRNPRAVVPAPESCTWVKTSSFFHCYHLPHPTHSVIPLLQRSRDSSGSPVSTPLQFVLFRPRWVFRWSNKP